MSNEKDNKTENQEETPQILPALNTIYYGPPGTGKTYTLNQLKEKLEKQKEDFDKKDNNSSNDIYDIIFNTIIEKLKNNQKAYSYLDLVFLLLRLYEDGYTTEQLKRHIIIDTKLPQTGKDHGGVGSCFSEHAVESTAKIKKHTGYFTKDENKKNWILTEAGKSYFEGKLLENKFTDIKEDIQKATSNTSNDTKSKNDYINKENYNFVTFHQKYGYEDFIEGIKPALSEERDENNSSNLSFTIKKGIFYKACEKALFLAGYEDYDECFKDTKENVEQLKDRFKKAKPYALFIDEINRANISAVFGELITLIEDTKRIGASEEMWVTLPVSDDKFCVPPNLYIIGTMNTADRSVALLDIALRRRFAFEYMGPDYSKIEDWSDLLKALNQIIYEKKKNTDFFIGHSFFLDVSGKPKAKSELALADIFNTKIIPLLMEYFQNNVNVVVEILNELSKVDSSIKFDTPSIENNFSLKLIGESKSN